MQQETLPTKSANLKYLFAEKDFFLGFLENGSDLLQNLEAHCVYSNESFYFQICIVTRLILLKAVRGWRLVLFKVSDQNWTPF